MTPENEMLGKVCVGASGKVFLVLKKITQDRNFSLLALGHVMRRQFRQTS